MKNKVLLLASMAILGATSLKAQLNVGSTSAPNASAILQATSTTKGFLPPSMTTAQRNAIVTPAYGLLIYNTDTQQVEVYTNISGTAAWGGSGTNFYSANGTLSSARTITQANNSLNFKGGLVNIDSSLSVDASGKFGGAVTATTGSILRFGQTSTEGIGSKRTAGGNVNGLDFYTGGTSKLSITSAGNVGVGTQTPQANLDVNGSIRLGGTSGGAASDNFLTLNNSTGIVNNRTAASVIASVPTIYNTDGALTSGRTINQSGNALNFTGGGNVGISGSVGIGTLTPTATLDVNGTANFGGAIIGKGDELGTTNAIGVRADGGLNMGQNSARNVNVGYGSASTGNGSYNNAIIGYQAGHNGTSGNNNVFTGYQAAYSNSTGYDNVYTGYEAGYSNSTGALNVVLGSSAGFNNIAGNYNTMIGTQAGYNASANGNVFIGTYAGSNYTNGQNNTVLGYAAGTQSAGTGSNWNSTSIGANSITYQSNQIQLGDANITLLRCNVGLTVSSDARFKYQVKENVPGLAFIKKLRPVTYRFDNKKLEKFAKDGINTAGFTEDASAPLQTGLLAQEVEKAVTEQGVNFDAVHKPTNPKDHYSLNYVQFVMPLIKGMQEQQAIIEKLTARLDALERKLAEKK